MKRIIGLLMVMFLSYGCASIGHQINQGAVDSIVKGKTTQQQILLSLGSPDLITKTGNGNTVYVYRYARAAARPESFIPLIGAFVGGVDVQGQMTRVTFGPDGTVKDFVSTQSGTELNKGLATGSRPDMPAIEHNKRP